ncbi:MAG: RNA polymerase factor sigma-54, partial [Candidatus Omnitrophica bacterium]|nr:RNA polymerase factor sigma-54 [Candidatus Omnitrophota bacterium]
LLSQAKMLGLDGKKLEIAEYLIYEMDDNGYITTDHGEVADALLVKVDEIEQTLKVIQCMEPAGIGARNVCECLQLQLKRMAKADSLEYTLVTRFLNEIARNDLEKIAKALRVDKKRVKNAADTIRKLNPRPASNMLDKEAVTIIPDLIAQTRNRKLTLRLNKDWLPQLRLYNPYESAPDIAEEQEAKKFIKKNEERAKALIDNLKRREETLYKVAQYILTFQRDNLFEKERFIKSLTINEVAKALGMHPSTISRTVCNKFVQISNDALPLKAFLSKGVQKNDGQIISKSAIKKKIEILIKNEDKTRPLSDEAIKERLAAEDIKVERRTIAKYRNVMRILPAHLRKKIEL